MEAVTACLPCLTWFHRRRDEDPERQRLFPPPSTILTPPRPRRQIPLINPGPPHSASTPVSPTHPFRSHNGGGRGLSDSGLSMEGRERISSISRAYQGRMQPVQNTLRASSPSIPSSDSSTLPTPATIKPLPSPNGPAAPNLPIIPAIGRSVSQPDSLSQLSNLAGEGHGVFAAHQVAGGAVLVRRPRSSTAIDRMSPIYPRETSDETEETKGRSVAHQGADHPKHQGDGTLSRGRSLEPSRLGRSVRVGDDLLRLAGSGADEELEREVVQVHLGLRELEGVGSIGQSRRARGRGRPERARRVMTG